MGCTFAPLVTVAMRNIDPRMAGAASGVLNTVRQVGLVIGTAAVGALLQNRLVVVHDQPGRDAGGSPARRSCAGRSSPGSSDAASNGIQVGPGRTAPGSSCRPGCPRA